MRRINLKDINPTTITNILEYEGELNLDVAFHIIYVSKIDNEPLRTSKKMKLPHQPIPGTIMSMRYKNMTRGIFRTLKNNDQFKNSITIDISLTDKNVSLKLSKNTIHMSGVKKFENSDEAGSLLFGKLRECQSFLDLIRANPEKMRLIAEKVKEKAKINEVYNEDQETIERRIIFDPVKPKLLKKYEFPIKMFQSCGYGYRDLDLYFQRIEWLFEEKGNAIVSEPRITKVRNEMINFNYSLGFPIIRWILKVFVNGTSGFTALFNNIYNDYVRIRFPIPGEKRKHNFSIYRSGRITQSGKDMDEMNRILNLLYDIIEPNFDKIVKPIIMKYKPSEK